MKDTPRASDPEAIFADHTPSSCETSQVTPLNQDVIPDVNVELVLSQVRTSFIDQTHSVVTSSLRTQASDQEMRDILNWMHDYESEDEHGEEEEEDAEQEKASSQKEAEEMYTLWSKVLLRCDPPQSCCSMASQSEVMRADTLLEKSAALLQEARKNSEVRISPHPDQRCVVPLTSSSTRRQRNSADNGRRAPNTLRWLLSPLTCHDRPKSWTRAKRS